MSTTTSNGDDDDAPAAWLRRLDFCLRGRILWSRCWCWVRHVYFPPTYSCVLSCAQRTRQAQLGHVVLVKAGHILIVGLGHGLLRLAHGQVVAYAVGVTFLRFFQSFVGQVHAGLRHLDLFLRRGNIEQRVAHIGVNLRLLVAQLRPRGIELACACSAWPRSANSSKTGTLKVPVASTVPCEWPSVAPMSP